MTGTGPRANAWHPYSVTLCLALGLVGAVALHQALRFRSEVSLARPMARVSVRASAAPAPAAAPQPATILPLKSESAPEKKRPKPRVASVPVVPAPVAPVVSPAPPVATLPEPVTPLPTLAQPGHDTATAPRDAPVLPAIPSLGAPPMPGAQTAAPEFVLAATETPGGNILVLGLLVDDQGSVIDSRIVVPSRFILGDMAMYYAYRGQKWVNLDPPLMAGERRWLELRIDQAAKQAAESTLP